ncbi:MAG: hypothetical protein ACJA04_000248, partial [Cellvibrionaceae bacterium]
SRYLAKLRQEAAKLGLHVRADKYGRGSNQSSIMVYSLSSKHLSENTPDGSLIRQNYKHDLHFYNEWQWQSDKNYQIETLPDQQVKKLQEFLARLPDDIVGFDVNPQHVGLWWQETHQLSVSEIKALLVDAEKLFM